MTACCFATIADIQILQRERRNWCDSSSSERTAQCVWRLHWLQDQILKCSAPDLGQVTPPSRVLRQEKHTHMWVIDECPSRGRRARRCRVRSLSCLLWWSLLNTRKWWGRSGENTRLCLAGVIYCIFTFSWWVVNACISSVCFWAHNRGKCASSCKWAHVPACTFERMLRSMHCMCVHESLCVWTSACSCLGQAWFLSVQRPPPCSQALLQGPKITSLSTLPGLWNNNTPGFPITTAPANGDGTENMCGQTRARGEGGRRGSKGANRWQRWSLQGLDLEQQLHVNHSSSSVLL